jgi:phage shock protein A
MADSLRNRVSQIIVGSAHALLDTLEDQVPEAMMEQAIRKVDGVIDEVRAELGKAAANRHLAQQQHADLNRRHLDLTAQTEEAIGMGRDDLARAAITKQLAIEAQIPVVEGSLTEIAAQEKELSGYVEALLGKKRDMEEALAQFVASRTRAASPTGMSPSTNHAQASVDKASDLFSRIFRRQTGLTMTAQKVSAEETAKLRELDDLVQSKRIEARLAQLKAEKK